MSVCCLSCLAGGPSLQGPKQTHTGSDEGQGMFSAREETDTEGQPPGVGG